MQSIPESFLDDEEALAWADAESEHASLTTTLLFPTLDDTLPWSKKAIGFFKQSLCRNFDRTQRVLMLNKAIQLVPDFREALFWRGILRFQNVNENLEDLQRALSLTKRDSCQYLIIQSQMSAMQRNPDAAVEELTAALLQATNDADRGEIHYFRAFANWWTDNDEEAVADALQATIYRYNTRSAFCHLADMCSFLHKPEHLVESYYKASLEPNPNFTELIKYSAWLRKSDRLSDALETVNTAIQINPYSSEGYDERSNLATPHREQDLKRAIELDTNGRLIPARRLYAAILADQGNFKSAIQVLTDGINIKSKFSLHCLRGQMLVENAETREAGFRDLRLALRMNPIDADTQYWMWKDLTQHVANSDPELAREAQLRAANAVFLRPSYSSIDPDLNGVKNPSFTFFPGEPRGLFEYLQQWGVYQYVGITRKAVTLLAQCDDPCIKFEILKTYWRHLYTWKRKPAPEVSSVSAQALQRLWKLEPSSKFSSFHRCMMDYLAGDTSRRNFELIFGSSRHRIHNILVSDFVEIQNQSEWRPPQDYVPDEDAFETLLAYLYRKMTHRPVRKSSAEKIANLLSDPTDFNFALSSATSPSIVVEDDPLVNIDFHFIRKDFAKLLETPIRAADVQVCVGPERVAFSCHRAVLASCKYFRAMFSAGLRESLSSSVMLDNVSPDAFKHILAFLYGAEVLLDPESCIEVLALSDAYDLSDLKLLCELYLSHLIEKEDIDDLHEIEEAAALYNAPRLAERLNELRAETPVQSELVES